MRLAHGEAGRVIGSAGKNQELIALRRISACESHLSRGWGAALRSDYQQQVSRSSPQVEGSIRRIYRLRSCAFNAITLRMPTLGVPFQRIAEAGDKARCTGELRLGRLRTDGRRRQVHLGLSFLATTITPMEQHDGQRVCAAFFGLAKAADMIAKRRGLIVNISFWAAQKHVGSRIYGVSKSATHKMSSDMAHELRQYGVSVVSLLSWLGHDRSSQGGGTTA
jgi:hypothetical protein